MNNPTGTPSHNRTGMAMSPHQGREMIENATHVMPGTLGDVQSIALVRQRYARECGTLGAAAPPVTQRALDEAAREALRGDHTAVFIDHLGERLAFERASVRIWTAVLSKFDAYGTWRGGPRRAEIESIIADEQAHFAMLHGAVTGLGADPTVMSPSADLVGIENVGLVHVVTDPRTDLAQSLHAVLIAELADNDAWAMLLDMATIEHGELVALFEIARETELIHLDRVRRWLVEHGRLEATGELVTHPD